MKEAASAQSIWNVTDVNHLNEMLGKTPITEDDFFADEIIDGSYFEPSNGFF
jgi:hypothetical protein